MKKTCMMMIALLLTGSAVWGQSGIKPRHISVAYHLTTNLVFPQSIKSVDRGSRDVLVQKAQGVENVLQLKAGIEDFRQTNLTVITADGHLHSFLVGYSSSPDLNLLLDAAPHTGRPEVLFSMPHDLESTIQGIADKVSGKKHFLRKKDKAFDIALKLGGIYVRDDLMYFQLELENDSHVGYDIEQLRFYVRDKKKAKRTASQEVELKPVFVLGSVDRIDGRSSQTVVVVMEKFTIPDKKYLAVEMMEGNGGRHLGLKLGNKKLMKSRLL